MAKRPRQFNGPAILAAMFRELDPTFRKQLYEKLQQISPIIARLVEQLEFVYSDLMRLEDSSLQVVLRLFPEKDWLVAWKLTSPDLQARLLKNMSKQKREDFVFQAKAQKKILKTQVIRLQMQMAKQVRELLLNGKLRLRSKRPLAQVLKKAS